MKTEIILWMAVSFAALFFIPGCKMKNQEVPERSKLQQKIGDSIYKELKASTRVTFFKVDPKSNKNLTFEIVSSEQELPDDLRWLLKETLTDDQTYFFNKTKMCRFVPEMGFRFKGEQDVVVLVGFSCRQVKFISGGREMILDNDPKREVFDNNFQELLIHLK